MASLYAHTKDSGIFKVAEREDGLDFYIKMTVGDRKDVTVLVRVIIDAYAGDGKNVRFIIGQVGADKMYD